MLPEIAPPNSNRIPDGTKRVIPFLKRKMDTTDEVAAILEDRDIQKIDAMYVPREAIRRYNARVMNELEAALDNPSAPLPSPYSAELEQSTVRQELAPLGNQRFFSPGDVSWKDTLKDLEWEVEVSVTNEAVDKQTLFTTWATILQTIATNPMVLRDPNARLIFNKILNLTGAVSPIELSTTVAAPTPMPAASNQGSQLTALAAPMAQ